MVIEKDETVSGNALAQGGQLTGNRVVVYLLLRGDAGIDGTLEIGHCPTSSTGSRSGRHPPMHRIVRSPGRRRAIGTACSYASTKHLAPSRPTSNVTRVTTTPRSVRVRRVMAPTVLSPRSTILHALVIHWCSIKPLAVAWTQVVSRDLDRELEGPFCSIVGGVITPPCGVPSVVGWNTSRSRYPALSHCLISSLPGTGPMVARRNR